MIRWLAAVLLLGGCAGPIAYASMSPEQIHEAVKDKDAFIWCGQGTYAGALIQYVVINADKGQNTKATIGKNCEITFDATQAYKPTAAP